MSEETFDEFLAERGILGACEDRAAEELITKPFASCDLEAGGGRAVSRRCDDDLIFCQSRLVHRQGFATEHAQMISIDRIESHGRY